MRERGGSWMVDVRPIVAEDDLVALGTLIVDAYRALPGWRSDPDYEAWLADVTDRAPGTVVVGAFAPEPIGCVTYVPPPQVIDAEHPDAEHADPDAASFRALAVAPEAQGRGIGPRLVEWCVTRAGADGAARLRIHTVDAMTTAQAMYVDLGFVREPSADAEWELPDGPLRGLAFVYEL